MIVGQGASVASGEPPSKTSGYFDIILGILLILFGIRRIRKEDSGPDKNKFGSDKSKSTVSEFIKYMLLGFGMFVINFTTTVLVFAAGKDIGLSIAPIIDKLIVILILTIITLIVVEIPLLIYLTMAKRSEKILGALNVWMQKNSKYLMAGIIFLFGIYHLEFTF